MKIIINNKSLNVIEYNKIFEKFKGLKFYFEPIENAYRFNSRYANTYFLCQRIDLVMTDINNTIVYLYPNLKTEKIIFPKFKSRYIYFLPLDSCKYLKVGEKIEIKEKSS